MDTNRKRQWILTGAVVLLILTAYALRLPFFVKKLPPASWGWTTSIRSLIYVFLFGLWGLSVSRRVLHRRARASLMAAAGLMVFWILIRHVKFMLPPDSVWKPLCWYLYYVPLSAIPLVSCMAVSLAGRAEDAPLPGWCMWGWIPVCAIIGLVLTNNLHQLVFIFPDGSTLNAAEEYRYGPAFLLVAGCCLAGLLAFLALVFDRSRLPNRGKRLLVPLIPACLLVAYSFLYMAGTDWLFYVFGDMSVTGCLLVVGILETCIGTSLIRSNTRYLELFHASASRALIVDHAGSTIAAADNCLDLPDQMLCSARDGAVMLENDVRLVSAPITDGRVFWTEDVSELAAATDRLKEVESFLSQRRDILEQELESSRKKLQAEERKRLYDRILQQTEGEIRQYDAWIAALETETDPAVVRAIVLRITVLCAYIKRAISLIFQAMEDGRILTAQFDLCICKELLPCICASGAAGEYSCSYGGSMSVWTALTFFHAVFAAAMAGLDALEAMDIRLSGQKRRPELEIRIRCSQDLSGLAGPSVCVSGSKGEWVVTVLPETEVS